MGQAKQGNAKPWCLSPQETVQFGSVKMRSIKHLYFQIICFWRGPLLLTERKSHFTNEKECGVKLQDAQEMLTVHESSSARQGMTPQSV